MYQHHFNVYALIDNVWEYQGRGVEKKEYILHSDGTLNYDASPERCVAVDYDWDLNKGGKRLITQLRALKGVNALNCTLMRVYSSRLNYKAQVVKNCTVCFHPYYTEKYPEKHPDAVDFTFSSEPIVYGTAILDDKLKVITFILEEYTIP